MDLMARDHFGALRAGKTFAKAAAKFEERYEAVIRGRRSPKWVQGHKDRICLHLMPFFAKKTIAEITSGVVQEYRVLELEFPRFGGHFLTDEGECRHAENQTCLPARVSRADRCLGPCRVERRGSRKGVRTLWPHHQRIGAGGWCCRELRRGAGRRPVV